MSLLEVLEQASVSHKADTPTHQQASTMESQKKAPMLTHHQVNVLKLVAGVVVAVALAIVLQVLK